MGRIADPRFNPRRAICALVGGFESLLSHHKSLCKFSSLCAPLPFTPEPSEVNVGRSDDVRVAAAGAAPPAPDDLLTLIPLDAPRLPARFALELETGTVVAHDGNTHGLYFFRERLADFPFHESAPLLAGLFGFPLQMVAADSRRRRVWVPSF